MQSTVKRRSTIGLVLAALIGIAPDSAAQTSPSSPGLKASIGIRTTPNRQSGRPGGTYVGDDMLPGESIRLNVTASGSDLCASGVWANEDSQAPPSAVASAMERSAAYVWRFDVKVIEVITDKITFDLAWQRTSHAAPGEVLVQNQHLTLREGEARPIDLLHGAPGSDCASVVLEVTAGILEDPAFQSRTIEWDLWLSGNAQAGSLHRSFTSTQGDSAMFAFEPVATTATQLSGKVDDVSVQVYGQLRGRVRLDGSIDVALNTERAVSLDPRRAVSTILPKQTRPANGSGQKNFIMKPGEAVKIVLPSISPRRVQLQVRTDPVTGERITTVVPPPAQSGSAVPAAANEVSLTIQARVQ